MKGADHSSNASKGRSMEYHTLSSTGFEDGDAPVERQRGL